MPRIWVSIGSNIDREHHIAGALVALRERFGPLVVSPVYETGAVGFSGAPFYNLVVGFDSERSPAELHATMTGIEAQHGRTRSDEKFAPRTLDLDVLTYGDAVTTEGGKPLPRDDIKQYAFVLGPLADVAPGECHPANGETYLALWQKLPVASKAGMARVDAGTWLPAAVAD